ncbi:MAG: hypothetical protein FK733_16740, partial [Asgard group archaeon]|nr:hypothetical protein [Asgard group archaeon]
TFDLALFFWNEAKIPLLLQNVPALYLFLGLLAAPMLIMTVYLLTHGLDGVGELLEILLSTLSHTVSYARIFAMNAVHGALSHIFLLTDFTNPTDKLSPVELDSLHHEDLHGVLGPVNIIGAILIGGIVILILEGLFSFIQTLRLQWVEFFSKVGYQGQGTKYESVLKERLYSKVG